MKGGALIFGWVGFILIQAFYIPQLVSILRTRNVSGLSLPAWVILCLGLFFYLIYSALREDIVFMVGNGMGVFQCLFVISLILKYRKNPNP